MIDLIDLKALFDKHEHVLDQRERRIVQMKLKGKTLREIGGSEPNRSAGKIDHNNGGVYPRFLSVERTRQLLAHAIHKMRSAT